MPGYDLLDHQKQIVRDMVKIYEDTGISSFTFFGSSQARSLLFDTQPERMQVAIPSVDDLHVMAAEGLVTLRPGPKGIMGGGLRQSAVDAVKSDFQRPASAPAGTIQHFYSPVGAVHSGPGNITIGIQDVGIAPADVAAAIADLRAGLDELDPAVKAEATEYLNELEAEVKAEVPKQSRIKSFVVSLCTAVSGGARFVSSLTSIAQAYGIDPETLKRITPGV